MDTIQNFVGLIKYPASTCGYKNKLGVLMVIFRTSRDAAPKNIPSGARLCSIWDGRKIVVQVIVAHSYRYSTLTRT